MTDWEPATEAEAALSEALRTGDQERYFRILARLDLLIPVAEEPGGRSSAGWGTWTASGRTHVLAFTSVEAMRTCLSDHVGSVRRVPYHDLAAAWPNQDWWLAINPGLAIEGYLPAWFVAQLTRGDVRLPGRTMGARARVEAAAAARARGAAAIAISELTGSTTLPARRSLGDRGRRPGPAVPPAPAGPAISAAVRAPLARGPDLASRPSAERPDLANRPPAERIGRARVPAHVAGPDPAEGHAEPDFVPDNDVEAHLLSAASEGQTDEFLSTLLLARVLVPLPPGASTSVLPGQPGFGWRREQLDGQPYVVVFTSRARMIEHLGAGTESVIVKFVQLIRAWPEESWSFAVNPGTPVGATLPGTQIRALAAWAAEVGLGDEPSVGWEHVEETPASIRARPEQTVVMQKPVPPTQVAYFLDRGYDRVAGFVHRASEAAHLTTLDQMYAALGLAYPGSPFKASDTELYLLRWTAYRPNLYRIPYGGRDEAGMRAMQGWVIERPPFRGNGFAPSESSNVVAEFKVDSARLPHGAQMWRLREGGETLIALLDADGPRWLPVSEPGSSGQGSGGQP